MTSSKNKHLGAGIAAFLVMTNFTSLPASAHETKLPLGNGQVSSQPKQDHVYSCKTRFNPNAPGARGSGAWIKGDYWYPELKPTVDGDVVWSNAQIKVQLSGNTRQIRANNLPSHGTGVYPVQRNDDAYRYDRNPNSIRSQSINLELPANPELASRASCVPMGMIGVALTGAAIYNALDARGDDAPAHEIQDECGGHPERRGQYHYHNGSDCMIEQDPGPGKHSGLIGYALDGFGIYGNQDRDGAHLSNADLDACHGHVGAVNWDGQLVTMYHYHLTDEYPYTLGCFAGTPVRGR
ncbi:YHYH protein [Maritalea myrionectae]|uniref:YHYH protein n=1 Tax=Maritalea myrionectae TaxID=454601 RepID=UPI000403563B|nr:YHYH protein [Maritalea myrionectae]